MRFEKQVTTVLVGLTVLLWMASASAQQVRFFPDFSSVANLQFNGNAHQANWAHSKVLRLTDGYPGVGTFHPENSTSWFTIPQQVNLGFTTYFKFQIHTAAICCTPGDGLAFVVQNASSTDASYGATGAGVTARGVGFGGLGYAGIRNSLAVEFDTHQDPTSGPPFWDPNSNHVAVQSCGTNTNGPVHDPGTYTIGNNNDVTSCLVASNAINSSIPHLGVNCSTSSCADGMPHEVVIEYTAPAVVGGSGTLKVWIDQPFIPGTHTPCPNTMVVGCPVAAVTSINIPYNIDNTYNSKGIALNKGAAWVGFTASQPNIPQAHDVMAWEFTPHAPAQVQQMIPPGGTPAVYSFGAHDTAVNYYPGFMNNGCDGMHPSDPCLMTVLATPIARDVFHKNRLDDTPFENEECLVYLGTGGNCIVYSITCQQQSAPTVNVTCPASLPDTCNNVQGPGCIVFSTSFYTADNVTPSNADYLKADPIGSNNWESIFVSFEPNVFDARTTGKGNTPSDFVATFRPNCAILDCGD